MKKIIKKLQKLDFHKLILRISLRFIKCFFFFLSLGCATLFSESLTTSFMVNYSANVISLELRGLKVMAVAYVSLSNQFFYHEENQISFMLPPS